MKYVLSIAIVICCNLFFSVTASALELHNGAGEFVFHDKTAHKDNQLKVHYYKPKNADSESPIVFFMHGFTRDALYHRDAYMKDAIKYNFILIAPKFDHEQYKTMHYHGGNILQGRDYDPKETSYHVIERVFDQVKESTGNNNKDYIILGNSAGGQFVHRMVLFYPQGRYRLAVASNAGYYTFPDFSKKVFYGLRYSHVDETSLAYSFEKNLIVLIGENDNDPNHKYLPKSEDAMAQGKHRLERAQNFFRFSKELSTTQNLTFNWQYHEIKDGTHGSKRNYRYLLPKIFKEKVQNTADKQMLTGWGFIEHHDRHLGKRLRVHYYRPAELRKGNPVIFAMHASDRDGKSVCEKRMHLAIEYKVILACPSFSKDQFSNDEFYKGNIWSERRKPNQKENYTYHLIDRLIDRIKQSPGLETSDFYLFGNTGSAYFPLRMNVIHPHNQLKSTAIANAFYAPWPDPSLSFPKGLKYTQVSKKDQAAFYGNFILIMAGIKGKSHKLDDSKNFQGTNLYERSKNFFNISRKKAIEMRTPFRWNFITVQKTKWSYTRMLEHAMKRWFQ